jgi:branched-chain amino acid transport system substrate-binding protein
MATYRFLFFPALLVLALASPALAQKKYGPGVSDSEIKIGQTMPYSGPLSALGSIGHAANAYFNKINAEGGINGRKIKFISQDDGYSPPKTLEMTRQLVEQEEVLLIFNTLGTPTNSSIHKYLNGMQVPHLFITTGADKWNDPKNHPWTIMGMASYSSEAGIYAKHIVATNPNARIAVLVQHDDFGRDYLNGFEAALGEKAKTMLVAKATYEVTDPTIDSQIRQLQASKADAVFVITTGKFTSQAIRKIGESEWKPAIYVPTSGTSVASVLQPAGLDKSNGVLSASYYKNATDKTWAEDPGMKDFYAFMEKWHPNGKVADGFNTSGYSSAQLLVEVLKRCGDDLTRENVLKQALSLKNLSLPMLVPGVTISTGPDDYLPLQQMQMMQFDGEKWALVGKLIDN